MFLLSEKFCFWLTVFIASAVLHTKLVFLFCARWAQGSSILQDQHTIAVANSESDAGDSEQLGRSHGNAMDRGAGCHRQNAKSKQTNKRPDEKYLR